MRVRFFVFLLLFAFVFAVFLTVKTGSGLTVQTGSGSGSGSGSMGTPSVKFKSWQVGRSSAGTDTTSKEQKSFITSTEQVCYFTASVVYNGTQGDSVSPIDPSKVTWSVENASHGMSVDGALEGNWSGEKHPSKLAASTSFNVVGKLKVPQHKGTSSSHCPNYSGTSTPLNGREDKPMTFTIKFSSKTEDGQDITPVALVLKQIEKDEIRQEYMDMARQTTIRKKKVDGNVLRVPARSEFTPQNSYDDGHYSLMIDKGLAKKEKNWEAALKTYAEKDLERKNVAAFDLKETGGYRNPHHHYYHVPGGYKSPRGWHQFGLALDVRGTVIDMVDDGKIGSKADRGAMENAAKKYAGASWTSSNYSDGHVHAQWEWEGSNKEQASTTKSGKFSLPPAGTDNVACDKQNENNCDVMVSSSTEHYVTCPNSKCGDSYWSCDSDDYDEHRLRTCTWTKLDGGEPCGKSWRSCEYPVEQIKGTNLHTRSAKCVTDPNGTRHCSENGVKTAPSNEDNNPDENVPITPVYHACGIHQTYESGNHSLQASCSETDTHGQYCTVTNYYACQTHTHQYLALISGACGHSYTASSAYSHRSEACSTNSNGDSCSLGSYYVCKSHTHQYPAPTIACAHPDCNEQVSDRKDHRSTCGSGNHDYWPGCPSIGSAWWHSDSTHQYKSCSRCSVNYRPCNSTARQRHTYTKRCSKEKWRRVNGKLKKIKCSKIFYSCQNGKSTCDTGDVWCQDKNGNL